MSIRNKILSVLVLVIMSIAIIITSVWYVVSNNMADSYLKNISESVMKDAYHAFEYLLIDTSYMSTMISLNESNIIIPVKELDVKEIKTNGQWNQEYLNNKRVIQKFINGLNGYKYYIVGISVIVERDCIFSTSHLMQNEEEIYDSITKMDQENLKTEMVMMDPIHVEGGKSTLSSDYVVPAVRAILDKNRDIIGYTVLYFDYGVIEKMFASNLPEKSFFQVINGNDSIIYSNCGTMRLDEREAGKGYVYNSFIMDNVGWKFIMAIPSDYYVSDIQRTTLLTAVLVAIIFLIAMLLLIILVSRMTREITALRDSMHEVSAGNLDVVHTIRTHDEIGQMGHTFNHMVVHIRELMEQVTEDERQKRLIEIAFLQAQINPHFVSNVLNMVVWMAKIQHADNIVPLINSLNVMLQSAMHQEHDFIKLESELDYVKNYIRIVEFSGSYDFRVEMEIDEDVKELYVLRFILQPVIENCIYHGLPTDLSKEGCIKIKAKREKGQLIITIEDNGRGMNREQIESLLNHKPQDKKTFNGIGIPNVNERIHLFFGEAYGLSYESEIGAFTRAIFQLPVKEQNDEDKNSNCR